MKDLILKEQSYELKDSITVKCEEYYKAELLIHHIPPLTNIILEYLNSLIYIEVYSYTNLLTYKENKLFSIKDIPGNSIIKSKDNDINLIYEESKLECLTKNSIDINWFKNYTLKENYDNKDYMPGMTNLFYKKEEYEDDFITSNCDILLIEETQLPIKIYMNHNDSIYYSGIVKEPFYLISRPIFPNFYTFYVTGKITTKSLYLPKYLLNTLKSNQMFQ